MATFPSKVTPRVDISDQSLLVPGSDHSHQSHLVPLGKQTDFLYDDVKTVLDVPTRAYRLSGNGPCFGYRIGKSEYTWISFGEFMERARNFGSGLVNIGMQPGQSTFIGIYARNCLEWVVTEYGCYNQSVVTVPLYDTLGPNACAFIIKQAEISIVICDTEAKARSLLEKRDNYPCLKQLVVTNEVSDEVKELARKMEVNLHLFNEIEKRGKLNPSPTVAPSPSDIATICYTSGTTGDPKGVMITHFNLIVTATAKIFHLGDAAPGKGDSYLSFLPLAHMMERIIQVILLLNGGKIGFFSGDLSLLVDDLKALKPTHIAVVPRLLNKIYDKVMTEASSSILKKSLLNLALRRKQNDVNRQIIRKNSLWDRLIFKRIRQIMGGRVQVLIAAGAPLAGNVQNFFRCALGCVVLQAYGQTEVSGACTMQTVGDYSVDGLLDVAEMGYFSNNNQGEICIRGPSLFQGYFKNPEKTSEALDENGWLHTGDIGMWLPNGTLKIIDRKKNIFKLAQGEYIVPEKIESIYLSSQFITQIFVHGESLQASLVAIAVPDQDVLTEWCKNNSIKGTWKKICENKTVKQFLLDDITKLGKEAGLKSFEQVKDIYLHPEPFTVESGLLTPTMKTKRPECRKYFSFLIDDMYKNMQKV
ncbi:long-chain-fatty-acid--CoA ligase 5-like [Stegodyphus dumicola]|uniref:long-chain-fatty-acid--CoA ligase 5-like n=1 Tax=Stegodyphus dumicola TaxID=202533 RepID=UPI0015AECE01|nr:long-chain-fatty-acid--CoA ligase 5-like [Stegodyphus dumicola]